MPKYKHVVKFLWSGEVVENIFYSNNPSADYTNVGNDSEDWLVDVYTSMTLLISNQVQGDTIQLYEWVDPFWELRREQAFEWVGTNIADPLPRQCAGVIIGKTATRRCQGRKFFAGFGENTQNAGLLGVFETGIMQIGALSWTLARTGGEGTEIQPGVFNAASGNVIPFIGYRVNPIMGTQRRRKAGVGI